jgi:hypothetical protein
MPVGAIGNMRGEPKLRDLDILQTGPNIISAQQSLTKPRDNPISVDFTACEDEAIPAHSDRARSLKTN